MLCGLDIKQITASQHQYKCHLSRHMSLACTASFSFKLFECAFMSLCALHACRHW